MFLWYLFASRQTSRIFFSCELCFVAVVFVLDFVLLGFILSNFIRFHSAVGATVAIDAADDASAVATVVAVAVAFAAVATELWSTSSESW